MKILERQLNNSQTQKNYRRVAWCYNFWSKITESKASEKVVAIAEIRDGEQIIEIACGTGLLFREIVKRNPKGRNIGIDLSNEMLAKAKKLLRREKGANYQLQVGDVFNLKISNESFDKLINNFMIDLMPENRFDEVLSEFHRILKPEGVAIISIFSEGNKKVNKFWVWLAKNFPLLLTNCRPVEIKDHLQNNGFVIEAEIDISQNTFPSKVYKLKKTTASNGKL